MTAKNTIRQARQRASYDRQKIQAVLREAPLCHVGFAVDQQPFVIPMVFGCTEEHLYLHGGLQSRLLQQLALGVDSCVTVTLLDGFVMARSAFHHSMNYRSVVLFGKAQLVEQTEEKRLALDCISDHNFPGRSREVRRADSSELNATQVLRMTIAEASLKQREGGPNDNPKDLAQDCWAGTIPLGPLFGTPVAAADLPGDTEVSASIKARLAADS